MREQIYKLLGVRVITMFQTYIEITNYVHCFLKCRHDVEGR